MSSSHNHGTVSMYSPDILNDLQNQSFAFIHQRERELSQQLAAVQKREAEISSRETNLVLRENRLAAKEFSVRMKEEQLDAREQTVKDRETRLQDEESKINDARVEVERLKQHTEAMERQRRARRTNSESYIEDTFPSLQTSDVIKLLSNSSERLRRHAIYTLKSLIDSKSPPTQSTIQIIDLAPLIITTLEPLLTSSPPRLDVLQFAVEIIGHPKLSLEYARNGECPRILELLQNPHLEIKNAALVCLRRILNSSKSMRGFLAPCLLPYINNPDEDTQGFVQEALQYVTTDLLENQQYTQVVGLAFNTHSQFREAVIPHLCTALRSPYGKPHRDGVVDAGILDWFDRYLIISPVPPDIVEFFTASIPLLALALSIKNHSRRLIDLLWHPDPSISQSSVITLRTIAQGPEDRKLALVQAELLPLLESNLVPSNSPQHVLEFAYSVIPNLALLFARNGDCPALIGLLECHYVPLRGAAMSALKLILASSNEVDKKEMKEAFLPLLNHPTLPIHILPLVDAYLPGLAADLASTNNLSQLIRLITHSDLRVRILCAPPLIKAIRTQSTVRNQLLQQADFITVLLRLADSPHADSIDFVAECLPPMSVEFIRAGHSEKIIALLHHNLEKIRKAAREGILYAAKCLLADQRALINAGVGNALRNMLESASDDVVEFGVKMLLNMSLAFGESSAHCVFLLEFLSHRQPRICEASTQALQIILRTDPSSRKPLRTALFSSIDTAPDAILEMASSTIASCLYTDLTQEEEFSVLFHIMFHDDSRIRGCAITALTNGIQNSQRTRTALCNAGFLTTIVNALDAEKIQQDILTWCSTFALPNLASTLSETGHVAEIIQLLHHAQLSIRSTAAAIVNDIADVSLDKSISLVENGLFAEILLLLEPPDEFILGFTGGVLPKIIVAIARAGEVEKVVNFLDHQHSQVREAATLSLKILLQADFNDRHILLSVLTIKVLRTPTFTLCNFAAAALADVLCDDIIQDRDFPVLFAFLAHSDSQIRLAAVSSLANAITVSEAFRNDLCKAGFLPKLIGLLDNPTPEVVAFASAALPALSLTISKVGDCHMIIRLLSHRRDDVCTSASKALTIIAKGSDADKAQLVASHFMSEIVGYLKNHNETLVDFVVGSLPLLGVQIAKQGELDKLLDLLSNPKEKVSQAALSALRSVMNSSAACKTSLVQALVPRLSSPLPNEIPFIAEAIPLLDSTFLDAGEGRLLLTLLWSPDEGVAVEADDAIRRLASKGADRHKENLILSGLIPTFSQLLGDVQYRDPIASLAIFVLPYVCLSAIENGACAVLVGLFRFQDPDLSRALDTALRDIANASGNYDVLVEADLIPELLQILKMQSDLIVSELICFLVSKLADAMIESGKFRDVVDLLSHPEASLRHDGALAIVKVSNGPENIKDALFNTAGFLAVVRESMEVMYTVELCTTVTRLAKDSIVRSMLFLENGFAGPLVRLAGDYSNVDNQVAGLRALAALTGTSADATPLVRADILRTLSTSIDNPVSELNVVRLSLQVVENIAKNQAQRFSITHSILRGSIIQCLSLDDLIILTSALKISEYLASETDADVKVLIQDGILVPLVPLLEHHLAQAVILACQVVQALAMTGTYRQVIIDSGARKALKKLTSLTHRSKMASTENKKEAQRAAEAALDVLGTRFAEIIGRRPSSKGKNKGNTAALLKTPTTSRHKITHSESGILFDESMIPEIISEQSLRRRNNSTGY